MTEFFGLLPAGKDTPLAPLSSDLKDALDQGHFFCEGFDFSFATDTAAGWVSGKLWSHTHGRIDPTLSAEQQSHILADFIQNPAAFLGSLCGQFAALLIDKPKGQCYLLTDRLGIVRLYYAETERGLAFSTSLKRLKNLHDDLDQPLAIDPQAIYNYLYFHMVPSPSCIYQGVHKLLPDYQVCFQPQTPELNLKPLEIPAFSEAANDEQQLVEQLHQALDSSVLEAREGVDNYGAFLSGGLDSSSLVGAASRTDDQAVLSFSMGFDAEAYDETPYARVVAEHFGANHQVYYVTPEDVLEAVPKVAAFYDEPFGNSSALPTYCCAKLAAEQGVQVLLAGDGGDELFAGNERYAKQRLYQPYLSIPASIRNGLLGPLIRALPSSVGLFSKAQSYIEQADMGLPKRLQAYNFLNRHAADEMFTAEFIQQVNTQVPMDLLTARYDLPEQGTDLNRMLFLDWLYTLADNDLRKVSEMCRMAGVEVAYPFLSEQMVNLSRRVPSKLKLKGGDLRYFYRRAVRGFLPDATLDKSKHGFGLPFGVWLREHQGLKTLSKESLKSLKSRGYLKPEFIDQAFELHQGSHASYYGELVWILMMLELWLQAHE